MDTRAAPGAGDITDDRAEGEWESRYKSRRAIVQIAAEGLYVGLLLLLIPVLLLLAWTADPSDWLANGSYDDVQPYILAWLSGLLGGAVFSTKWLYHSVAKGYWHTDRVLWRLFTPHLSAAFALGLVALLTSGLISVLDDDLLREPAAVVGVSFVFGYFSDYTVARLSDFAQHLLGESAISRRSPNL